MTKAVSTDRASRQKLSPRNTAVALLIWLPISGYPALADTVAYNYDLRGRLVTADYGGGGDAYTSSYTYDNADNRKTAKVINSDNGNQPYIVVPGNDAEAISADVGNLTIEPDDSNSVEN